MDKEEALREISCAIKSLGLANRVLIESGAIEDEEDIEDAKGILSRAREGVDYLEKQFPAHPAIPEEVRKFIELKIDEVLQASVHCDDEDSEDEVKQSAMAARDWLAKCHNQEPPKPAIPEEVRETLDRVLACPRIWEPIYPRAAVEFASAREWVTACPTAKFNRKCRGCKKFIALHRFGRCLECHNKKYPTATDKAVCPKCWESDECTWTDIGKIRCWRCRHDFSVQVLVISPPREPKVAP